MAFKIHRYRFYRFYYKTSVSVLSGLLKYIRIGIGLFTVTDTTLNNTSCHNAAQSQSPAVGIPVRQYSTESAPLKLTERPLRGAGRPSVRPACRFRQSTVVRQLPALQRRVRYTALQRRVRYAHSGRSSRNLVASVSHS